MSFFSIKSFLTKACKPTLLLILFTQLYFHVAAQAYVRSKLVIQLLLNTNPGPQNTADGVVAFFADNFSTSIGNEDSYKFTNLDENLAIDCRGTLLSIEGRPMTRFDTLKLVMWQFRQKSYYLQLNGSNFSSKVKAVVKDKYLSKETAVDLSSSTTVPFTITGDSASFAANRFSVVFKTSRSFSLSYPMKLSSVFKENTSFTMAPNPVTGNTITLQMHSLKMGRYAVNLYSNEGRIVYSGFIDYDGSAAWQTIMIDKRVRKGMYSLLLTSGTQTFTKKVLFQ